MTPEEVREIWNQAKANGKTLDACDGPHAFEDITPDKPLMKRFKCKACGGEVSADQRAWYEKGLAHGRAEVKL